MDEEDCEGLYKGVSSCPNGKDKEHYEGLHKGVMAGVTLQMAGTRRIVKVYIRVYQKE